MSDDTSARLALPLMAAGQAQKEMTLNEALAVLDIAVQARAVSGALNAPPSQPAVGDCWIVGESPSDAWSGMAGALAGWTADGWRFVAPIEGMTVWLTDRAVVARRIAGAWRNGEVSCDSVSVGGVQVVGAQQPAIADPAGGEQVDTQARATLSAMLATLRRHGLISA